MATDPEFKAFISYSRAADGQLAPAMQSALQAFAKPWYALRACRVFRDQTTLAITSALWPAIEHALLGSEFFILLASPESAESEWVRRELECWLRVRGPERLLIVLTDGEIAWSKKTSDFDWPRTTALPRSLAGAFPEEPLFLDLCWARREEQVSVRDPRFLDAVASLSSRLRAIAKDEIIGRDVREHRLRRRIVRATVAALTLLTAAAIAAAVLANIARELAESRRVQARSVAEAIVFEVEEMLSPLPEAAAAREALTEKARGLLEMLGDEVPDLQRTRALMVSHTRTAEAALARGDLTKARTEFELSLTMAQKMRGLNAMKGELIRDVSVCLNKLGALLARAGDYAGARRYLDQDVALTRQLLARTPADVRSRNDLATSLEKLGNVCLAARDFACAHRSLDEDLRIMRDLHTQLPNDEQISRELAIALVQVGELKLQSGQLKTARELFAEAVGADERLHAISPSDGELARNFSVALLKLGDVQIQQRSPAEALTAFERAVALRRELLRRAPNEPARERDVAVALGRVASAHFQTEQPELGLAPMHESLERFQTLTQRDDSDEAVLREVAVSLYDMAGAEARLQRYSDAKAHLDQGIDLLRRHRVQAPTSSLREELFQSLRRAGLVELALGHAPLAQERHQDSCQLAASMPADALDAAALTGLFLDLAQISEEHAASDAGSSKIACLCSAQALDRFEQLRKLNAALAQERDIAETVIRLRRIMERPKR